MQLFEFMIKSMRSIWMVVLVMVVFACKEDDPLPLPTLDFTNETAEVGRPVMFDNLTTNADRYEWKFSDGQTSESISPSITFKKPGAVEVVLKAFTKDGQIDSLVRNITVKQRYLTAYAINIYPLKDDGADWDAGEAGDNIYPDIFLQLLVDKDNPSDDEFENALFEGIFNNVKNTSFSRGVGDQGFPDNVILTDESWGLALFDFDGADISNPKGSDFYFMAGVTFNPVQAPTFKVDDEGFISIFFSDGITTLDFDLYFELK